MEQFKQNETSYYKAQREARHLKATKIWVQDAELQGIAEIILDHIAEPELGICHGARTGYENRKLATLLGIEVIGTDLIRSDNSQKLDFHERTPQWEGKADFVYTNSLDHSYDHVLALTRWIETLKPNGILLIHWGNGHGAPKPTAADCFRASRAEYRKILNCFGEVREHDLERERRGNPTPSVLFVVQPKRNGQTSIIK